MHKVLLISVAGPTAGTEWTFERSSGSLLSRLREVGIPKFDEQHRPDDLGGMWYTAFVHPQGRAIGLKYVHVSSSQKAINKKLYNARSRGCTGIHPPYKGQACVTCPLGRSVCGVSRIHTTFTITRECLFIEEGKTKHKGLFKDLSSPYCFSCLVSGKGK